MLISCLCPTADRRPYLPLAITCFLRQDWPHKELLILDDGDDDVADLIPTDPRIRPLRAPSAHQPTPQKLNLLAQQATGEIICHWDDDDWSAPSRLTRQATDLLASHKAMTGFDEILYWDDINKSAHIWRWRGQRPYACGTSQMTTRHWYLAHPQIGTSRNHDLAAANAASSRDQLHTTHGGTLLVARFHQHSHWPADFKACRFPKIPTDQLPLLFLADIRYNPPSLVTDIPHTPNPPHQAT
jgi:glycosyltransferase involved in cell wall biosynthesis